MRLDELFRQGPPPAAPPAADPGDPAAIVAQAEGALQLTLGKLSAAADMWLQQQRPQPDMYSSPRFVSVTSPPVAVLANGTAVIDIGGPKSGFVWMVRRVSCSDSQNWATTMTAALGQVYTGDPSQTAMPLAPGLVTQPFAALPGVLTFGNDIFPVRYGEHIVVGVTGGNVAQALQATATFQIYSQAAPFYITETI